MDMKEALRGVGDTLRCSVGQPPNRYLAKIASDMLKPCPKTAPPQVGVWLFNLVPGELHTISLFDDASDDRQLRLSRVVDELNQCFGKSAVYFAIIQSCPRRRAHPISFTSVPELGEF